MIDEREQFRQFLERAKTKLAVKEAELEKLNAQRDTVLADIEELKRNIRSLAQLAGESEDIALGLTAACKEVFLRTDQALTATEVKGKLIELGFPIGEHKHALASISTTLRRLVTAGVIFAAVPNENEAGAPQRWKRKSKVVKR
jgi:chromosome segregation ATPase